MPYASSAYGTAELAAYNRDCPLFVGHNLLRDAVTLRWTSTGTNTGTDITVPVSPAYRAFDGRIVSPTRAFGSISTVYLNIRIPPSTIDTIALIFLRAFPSSTVTVQIADDAAFTTNVVDFAGPFAAVTGIPRLVRSFNGTRYTSVEFIRVRFVIGAGNYTNVTMPKLGECFLGRGYPLSRTWDYGSDEEADHVESADFEARSGEKTRTVFSRGKRVLTHQQVLSTGGLLGLDDAATTRTIAQLSLDHTRPVLHIPHPSTALNTAFLGHLPTGGLELVQTDYDIFEYHLDFDELPFFRSLEV